MSELKVSKVPKSLSDAQLKPVLSFKNYAETGVITE